MSTPERLTVALADRYRIERELGQGGMATVYLAHDLKHDRDVAIKVLHPDLGAALGGERFLSEIRTTARLQHPHILPLLDSGDAGGLLYYVMPVVTGETLRAHLERERQLPIPEAVRIAREVASALDYAHRQGVIHRDIKPENILLHDGQALVADFGIALAVQTAGGQRMTQTGLSLGTPQYMSPEQAMGERTIDARSDVYALGAVTYEMLTGDAPFTGSSVQAIVAKVLSAEAERPTLVRKTIPPYVEAAVLTAIAKLPADRFASAALFADALADRNYASASHSAAAAVPTSSRNALLATSGFAVLALAVATWALATRPAAAPLAVLRVNMSLPEGVELFESINSSVALAPDGEFMVFASRSAAGDTTGFPSGGLWLRRRNELQATPIVGTDGAQSPFISRDGRRVGFIDRAERSIFAVDLAGGPPTRYSDSPGGMPSAAFASDGSIISASRRGLARFVAAGGAPELLSTVDTTTNEESHGMPDVLPNGRGIIFTVHRRPNSDVNLFDVAVLDLRTGKHRVLEHGVTGRYSNGFLVVLHADGVLVAARFDEDALEIRGPVVPIASGVEVRSFGGADFALSADGTLVYRAGGSLGAPADLIWVSRAGAVTPAAPTWRANFEAATISPDGSRIAAAVIDGLTEDIWVTSLAGAGSRSKITFNSGRTRRAVWFPDGGRVAFVSADSEHTDIEVRRADGTGGNARIFGAELPFGEVIISPNGEWLVYRTSSTFAGRGDIFAWRFRDSTLVPLATTGAAERHPSISPDGRWIAYLSDESGRGEVYVRPFPNVDDGRWVVSQSGGDDPLWSPAGNEIFYVADERMMAVPVSLKPTFSTGVPHPLFALPLGTREHPSSQRYDVSRDGNRFLMIREASATVAAGSRRNLVLVTNFIEELRAKLRSAP